eukprot:s4218_g4.t1
MSVPSHPAPQTNFTLVCVRRLEQEVIPEGGELALSHDRCLLSRVDGDGRCICYSCDNTRPEFSLSKPVAEEVSTCVWQHIPAETQVDLSKNALSEYPGVACLVALHRDNAALTCCRFVGIETADAEVNTSTVEEIFGERSSSNTVWKHSVPLFLLLRLLPACREHLAAAAAALAAEEADALDTGSVGGSLGSAGPCKAKVLRDWTLRLNGIRLRPYEGEESAIKTCKSLHVRISVATAQTLVLILDDAVATVLSFRWKGVFATHCFYMQRLCPSPLTDQRLDGAGIDSILRCSHMSRLDFRSDAAAIVYLIIAGERPHAPSAWYHNLQAPSTKPLSESRTHGTADPAAMASQKLHAESLSLGSGSSCQIDSKFLRKASTQCSGSTQAFDSEMTVQVVSGEVQGLVYEWGIQDSWQPIHFTKARLQVLGYTDITVEKLSRNRTRLKLHPTVLQLSTGSQPWNTEARCPAHRRGITTWHSGSRMASKLLPEGFQDVDDLATVHELVLKHSLDKVNSMLRAPKRRSEPAESEGPKRRRKN